MAQIPTYASAMPTLQVTTIAEDDQIRNTGVIVMDLLPHAADATHPGWDKGVDPYCVTNTIVLPDGTVVSVCEKKLAQYKIMVSFMGQPVPFTIACQFIKKELLHPLQHPQFTQEVIATALTDESANFVCKLRQSSPALPGVGVLDVYYVGVQQKQYIADYIMALNVWTTIGRTTVYGTDMQDICVLGWAIDTNTMLLTKPDGKLAFSWPDPLGSFVSCEDAAVLQRQNLGLPILYD
jgi:hypothetical protein